MTAKTYISTEFRIIYKIAGSILALEAVGIFLTMPLRRNGAAAMAIGVGIAVLFSLFAALDSRRSSVLGRVICFGWLTFMSILAALVVWVLATSTFDASL